MDSRNWTGQRRMVIPESELEESASRSGGPGGQHVNKTSTRVTLRWSVKHSAALRDTQRAQLIAALGSRLTRAGELVVHCGRFRSRSRNRDWARERLEQLVGSALTSRPHRVATKPTTASKLRSRQAKKRRSTLKLKRGRVRLDSDS